MADDPQDLFPFPDDQEQSGAVDLDEDGLPEGMGDGDVPLEYTQGSREQRRPAVPVGFQEVVMSREQNQQMWNAARHFVVASRNPSEYLPLANLTHRDLHRQKRMIADESQASEGFIDVPYVMWWGIIGSTAIGGKGRDDAKEVITGYQRMQERARGLGRFVGRSNHQDPSAAGGSGE